MRPTGLLCAVAVALAALTPAAFAASGTHSQIQNGDQIIVGMPIRVPFSMLIDTGEVPVGEMSSRDDARHSVSPSVLELYVGENLTASSLRLASNYDAERGCYVVGAVTNTGAEVLLNVICRLYLGDPGSGGTQIGDDLMIPSLPVGSTVRHTVFWAGFTGSSALHFVVDPDNAIAEENEEDNEDVLSITMRNDVPWVWQIVNGYCNYASLSMIFNLHGAENTVYETAELASCPHTTVYIDDKFYLYGGLLGCQTTSDYHFAGDIRNLDTNMEIRSTWPSYMMDLTSRLNDGLPVLTGVDPYHLPQPDYDPLRLYGIHGGHAVVVTGYSDSSVVINDPGVGLDLLGLPPIPNPERRGADVIVDLATFRLAVESTLGASYVLITYTPEGFMTSHSHMLHSALGQSVLRIEGDPDSYGEPLVTGWPPGWDPTFGVHAFETAQADMNYGAFLAWFDYLMASTGGNLVETLNTLAAYFVDNMFFCGVAWEGSGEFYQTLGGPEADNLALLSVDLAIAADGAFSTYVGMLQAIWDAGGDPSVAVPYLSQVAADLAQIAALEGPVRENLAAIRATSVSDEGVAGIEEPSRTVWCVPNPFVGSTEIHFSGRRAPNGALRVYDVAGRLVGEIEKPGSGAPVWSGCDASGIAVAPGIYFVRDSGGGTAKVVKLK